MSEAQTRLRVLSGFAAAYRVPKRLLDVGCASGIFLEQARNTGWDIEGVELSPVLCNKAKSRGLPVTHGWLESQSTNAKYPVVTAWEVIEHTLDPEVFLNQLYSRTERGGLIALSTPLSNGLPALLLRSRFPMICPPEHLSLFSKKSIKLLGARFGLQLIYFRSFSNLRKDNLKRGLDRFVFGQTRPTSVGSTLSSFFATLLQPLPRMVDALGLGTEMEIVFRKAA